MMGEGEGRPLPPLISQSSEGSHSSWRNRKLQTYLGESSLLPQLGKMQCTGGRSSPTLGISIQENICIRATTARVRIISPGETVLVEDLQNARGTTACPDVFVPVIASTGLFHGANVILFIIPWGNNQFEHCNAQRPVKSSGLALIRRPDTGVNMCVLCTAEAMPSTYNLSVGWRCYLSSDDNVSCFWDISPAQSCQELRLITSTSPSPIPVHNLRILIKITDN